MKSVFLPVLFFIATAAAGQQTITGFQLVKGETYYHNSITQSKVRQTVQGMDVDIDMTVTGKIQFTVTEVLDTVFQMDVRYNELGISMKTPTGEMVMSSEGDTSQLITKVLRQMESATFPVKMSRPGRILEVKKLDELVESMLNTSGIPEAQKPAMRQTVLGSFGETSFKSSFELLTHIYSPKPVKLHDHWLQATNLVSAIEAVIELNYEWKESTPGYNLIEGTGTILSDASAPFKPAYGGIFMKHNVAGKVNTSIKTDPRTGWLLEGTMKQDFSGITEIKESPGGTDVIKMAMSASNDLRYSSQAPQREPRRMNND